ncbi:MAG: very short patch repair endonuclease [candidate division Zixibacteria bacterium]|nr:very short patch repair endonuclease [candidate division Zixibacteria bacterium]
MPKKIPTRNSAKRLQKASLGRGKTSFQRARRRPREVVRKAMRAVKSRDTTPEIILRKALWARGYRYRLHDKTLLGKPDLVLKSRKAVVFIDGDFWHGRQWKKRGFDSLEDQMGRVRNSSYWIKKIKRNMERDKTNRSALRKQGWKVICVWESDLKKNPVRVINKVVLLLG